MGTVLSTLGVVAATTGGGLGGLSPRANGVMHKAGAVLLPAAGACVIFYWGRVVFGDVMAESRIANAGNGISAGLRAWLSSATGRWATLAAFGGLALAAAAIMAIRARNGGVPRPDPKGEKRT